MALRWDVSKVRDYKTLHNDDAEWVKTEALVFMTMGIGMRSITEKNVEEFARRVGIVEELSGASRYDTKGPIYFTKADIVRRIGLSTNASTITKARFDSLMGKRLKEKAETRMGAS